MQTRNILIIHIKFKSTIKHINKSLKGFMR